MNKAKKIIFEPKIPETKKKDENIKKEVNMDDSIKKDINKDMKGVFAPRSFSVPREFRKENFIFNNLPAEATALVEFEDGTYGIKCQDKILECEIEFIGDSVVVDFEEKVKKIGDPDFIFTVN